MLPGNSMFSIPVKERKGPYGLLSLILYIMFFLSGTAALIYQVAWQRLLASLIGSNNDSTCIVVSLFLGGLGLGAYLGALLSRKRRRLLFFVVLAELSSALYGFLSRDLMEAVFSGLGPEFPVIFMASLFLIGFPCICMGLSMPLLVQYLKDHFPSDCTALFFSRLYGLNTLGGALAALATVMLFFPLFGLRGSLYAAASMDLFCAAIICFFIRTGGQR